MWVSVLSQKLHQEPARFSEWIQSCLAEVWIVPQVEEVEGLLSCGQLLGFQPFSSPLSVNILEQSWCNPLPNICERTLCVQSSFAIELISRLGIVNLRTFSPM